MVDRFLYYFVVIPASKLPYWAIYLLADFFYFILLYVFPYRKKVVFKNIKNSFPDKSNAEIKSITKEFYRFFADLMLETIKLLGISKSQLQARIKVKNMEVVNKLYEEGRSFIMLSSHYNNWEYIILAQDFLFPHQAIGIGMPLSNKYWHKKITAKRERFGMKVTDPNSYKELIKAYNKPTATLVLNDQSPGKNKNCYWTTFLNQETAFYFGAEVMAHEQNMPVIHLELQKQKRGHYEFNLELLAENSRELPYGEITKKYIQKLEDRILSQPSFWLWSHKRWKKKIPEDLPQLKVDHKKRFEDKFNPQH